MFIRNRTTLHLNNQKIESIINENLSYFCDMKDPRIERRKLHPLDNIIFITIAAVLCGAETWEDLEDFGYAK